MRIRDWINRGVGLGLLISLLLCAAGAALGAILMSRELLAVESAGKWMAFMWLLASFVGCKFALRESQGRLPHAAVQAVLLYFVVWAAALAVSAVPDFRSNGWYITGAIWGGAALAALMPDGKRKRAKRKPKSRRGRAHKGH